MSKIERRKGVGRDWLHGHVTSTERVWDQAPYALEEHGLKDAKKVVDTFRARGWDMIYSRQHKETFNDKSPIVPTGVGFQEPFDEDNPSRSLHLSLFGPSITASVSGYFGKYDSLNENQVIPPLEKVTEIVFTEGGFTISSVEESRRALKHTVLVLGDDGSVSYFKRVAPKPLE